jgi:hypothetical protein
MDLNRLVACVMDMFGSDLIFQGLTFQGDDVGIAVDLYEDDLYVAAYTLDGDFIEDAICAGETELHDAISRFLKL